MYAQNRDTIFLLRETADTPYAFYHAVFIDTSMKFKNELTNFNFNSYDSATYFDQINRLRPLKVMPAFQNDFPKTWVLLYRLKGKYYLYNPSELGYNFRFKITDSTTIDYTMEGPEPSRLNKISFVSPTQAIIDRTNYWEGKHLSIKLVDIKKGVAVFTFSPTKYNKEGYQVLMVDARKAHLFPVIVNYCPTDKQPEFDFDKIDFKTLLK
jgi:hypothetical protein